MTNVSDLQRDLIVLVADKDMESAVKGILSRPESLGIRSITFDCYIHPSRDSGCFLEGHSFIRLFQRSHTYALIMFDHDGCGREKWDRARLEVEVEQRLLDSGWENRSAAIVLQPELEIWVWSDSPEVDKILGWGNREPSLRTWLNAKGFLHSDQTKPDRPKEAVEKALRSAAKPLSPMLYFQLAQTVSFNRCADPAFAKLKEILKNWFATEQTTEA